MLNNYWTYISQQIERWINDVSTPWRWINVCSMLIQRCVPSRTLITDGRHKICARYMCRIQISWFGSTQLIQQLYVLIFRATIVILICPQTAQTDNRENSTCPSYTCQQFHCCQMIRTLNGWRTTLIRHTICSTKRSFYWNENCEFAHSLHPWIDNLPSFLSILSII